MSMKIEEMELNHFIVRAKKVTYASGGDEYAVTPALKNTHQLEYLDGNLLYRDIYYGGLHFIGMETVFHEDLPIWGMSYYGSVLPNSSDQQISGMPSILKAALRAVPLKAPFRGPPSYQEPPYSYQNEIVGEISCFHGTETISFSDQVIYRLFYSGGKVS